MKIEKFDPGLLSVLWLAETEAPNLEYGPFGTIMALGAGGENGPMLASVFVRCADPEVAGDIDAIGAWVSPSGGRLVTATLPVTHLSKLSDLDGVERIYPGEYLRPQLDQALAKTRVLNYRTANALTGAGVVIGVVDSGVDASHSAFAGRILRVWDQTLPGPGVREGTMGSELTGSGLPSSVDDRGHGTHVAGIAAGRHAEYGGVAPGATLLVVKTLRSTTQIAQGIQYIFRVARELGRPAVVNLSLSAHWDSHDGKDPLSEVIDRESGPGRIVCAAAGNDGNESIHARRTIEPAETVSIRLRVPPRAVHIVVLNGWYGGDGTLEFAVRSPSDAQTPWQAVITPDNPRRTYAVPGGQINVVTGGRRSENGDFAVRIELLAATVGHGVQAGVWQLLARNAGAQPRVLDAWVLDGVHQHVAFSGKSVDDSALIGAPGAAGRAITVGSYTTRVAWRDSEGTQQRIGLQPDSVSDFSSAGPLRGGNLKPDLVAPGAMIISARSAAADSDPHAQVGADCLIMQGTSMATPFVTGIVALLLEQNPRLSPEEAKAEFQKRCRVPGQPPGTYDPKWGYGFVTF